MPIKGKMVEVEVETIERCLGNDNGDYQVEGINDVTIERKSLEDLYSTLAKRDSFQKQIEWMNFSFRFSAVVIEGSWDDICDPTWAKDFGRWKRQTQWLIDGIIQPRGEEWKSRLHPNSAVATIHSWSIRYPRVHWLTPGSRRNAEVVTFDILRHAWRHRQK